LEFMHASSWKFTCKKYRVNGNIIDVHTRTPVKYMHVIYNTECVHHTDLELIELSMEYK
jgi:hypothetical protein